MASVADWLLSKKFCSILVILQFFLLFVLVLDQANLVASNSPDVTTNPDGHPTLNRHLAKSLYRRNKNQRAKTKVVDPNRTSRSLYNSAESFTFASDYPDGAEQQPNERENNHGDHQSIINDAEKMEAHWMAMDQINHKMDTMIKLLEVSFGKALERIEKIEQSMDTMQKIIKLQWERSEELEKMHQKETLSGTSGSKDPLTKMYSVLQHTYEVCKDAVVNGGNFFRPMSQPMMDGNCPVLTTVCSMVSQYRQHHKDDYSDVRHRQTSNKHDASTVIMAGHSDRPTQKRQASHEQQEDLDGQAMKEVFGMFANWTLDQYVQRMHRNVAEELSVFNFELKERMQQLSEKLTKLEVMYRVQDQISTSVLEIRDQVVDDREELDKIFNELRRQQDICGNVYQRLQQQQQQPPAAPEPSGRSGDCVVQQASNTEQQHLNQLHNRTTVQIKTLFQEYFDKIINYLDSSLPNIQSTLFSATNKSQNSSSINIAPNQPIKRHSTVRPAPTTTSPSINNQNGHKVNEDTKSVTFVGYNFAKMEHQDTIKVEASNDRGRTDNGNGAPEFQPPSWRNTRKHTSKHSSKCSRDSSVAYPSSCLELHTSGATCNGVYVVLTAESTTKQVFCDMSHNGGGWTVIMRRGKFRSNKFLIDFRHNLNQFRSGFGDLHSGEFWIGLDYIHMTTSKKPHLLQVDLMDTDGDYVSLVYHGFRLGNKKDGFTFYVNGIQEDMLIGSNPSWNLTDLAEALVYHNKTQFITEDQVSPHMFDGTVTLSSKQQAYYRLCAEWFRSGWWYPNMISGSSIFDKKPLIDTCRDLTMVQLLAPFEPGHDHLACKWKNWYKSNGHTERQLRYIMMKIRPVDGAE